LNADGRCSLGRCALRACPFVTPPGKFIVPRLIKDETESCAARSHGRASERGRARGGPAARAAESAARASEDAAAAFAATKAAAVAAQKAAAAAELAGRRAEASAATAASERAERLRRRGGGNGGSSADSSGGDGSGGNANGDGSAGGGCGSVSSDSGGGGDLSAHGTNDNALILPPSVLARVSACLSPEESSLPLLLAQFDAASDPWTQRYPQSGGFVIHLLPPAPPRLRDFGKEHAAFIVKARRAAERRARHALGDDPRAWLDVVD